MTETEKIKQGSNKLFIALTLELVNILNEHAGRENQNIGFWLMKHTLLENEPFRKLVVDKYGEKILEELVAHYSKTNTEQRDEERVRKEEARIRQDARFKIDQLRTEIYQKQVEKQEDRSPETIETIEARISVNEKRFAESTDRTEKLNLHNEIERDRQELEFKKTKR